MNKSHKPLLHPSPLHSFRLLLKEPVSWALLICCVYWTYLFSSTRMIVSCDAIAYESTARILRDDGWVAFFQSGPHREPVYPFLVACAMRLASTLSVSFQNVLVTLQLLILLITQALTFGVVRMLGVRKPVAALAVLFLGTSPAIVNSAFSLFSEIASYPLILSLVLANYAAWRSCRSSPGITTLLAITNGTLLSLNAFNKAIFEFIAVGYIVFFFLLSWYYRKERRISRAISYCVISGFVFYSLIGGYKILNKKYNGNFTITERGDLKLYGTAVRRTQDLTRERFLTALAYVPGEGFCERMFGTAKCSYWGFEQIDNIGFAKLAELKSSGYTSAEAGRRMMDSARGLILRYPVRYSLFYVMEAARMLFWESTTIGFVSYPASLERLFGCAPFKNGLRFIVSFLTAFALAHVSVFLARGRHRMQRDPDAAHENPTTILPWCTALVLLFIGFYALVDTVTRYALPIAPLYLILVAFSLDRIIPRRR